MICYLDLDGVLVDFIGGSHKFYSLPYDYNNYPYKLGDWDCLPPPEFTGKTTRNFWDELTEDFWANLDWMPDGKEILRLVEEEFGAANICLLTSPTWSPSCASGKLRWIQRELPQYARQFAISPCKQLFAHSGSLLIDDCDKNVDVFRNAGGFVILIPRKWNQDYEIADSVGKLKSLLKVR